MKFLEKLESREKLFLLGGLLFLIVVLVILGGQGLHRLQTGIGSKVASRYENLQTLQRLKNQILGMGPARKVSDKSVFFTKVNEFLERHNLKTVSINENEKGNKNEKRYRVTVRLQSVLMLDLLRFLHDIEFERSMKISVDLLRIRRAISKKDVYDVNVTVSTPGGG